MAANRTDIWVYASWKGLGRPQLIGTLSAHQAKGKKAFSFEYEKTWINSQGQILLDPDISWYTGSQFPTGKENFGVFLDSMPDTWGRKLMQRKVSAKMRTGGTSQGSLYDIDYLLGVHDVTRMGALRFKLDPDGPFLDNDPHTPTPPWAHIRDLQHSVETFEDHGSDSNENTWLELLFAPGSSLGGARPKANILDKDNHLWIAKFPSRSDTTDKAAWEYLAYRLAIDAGIDMAECKLETVRGPFRTFFTKRFDREDGERLHFASAMTMTGKNESLIRDDAPSYLDIAEFLQYSGADIETDLQQLWRRMVFNITISNTDDHLRNHGFLLSETGWRLSPAYDLNPSIDKSGLALNIDMDNNMLNYDLAKSVGVFFHLDEKSMDAILEEVRLAVGRWREVAAEIGISRGEQELMASAFRLSRQN